MMRNDRSLGIAALIFFGFWATTTAVLGVTVIVEARLSAPVVDLSSSTVPWPGVWAIVLFLVWIMSYNGLLAAVICGAVAIIRAKGRWLRGAAFVLAVPAFAALAMWISQQFPDGPTSTTFATSPSDKGLTLIVTAIAGTATIVWLLGPALRRLVPMPPPDPATALYSESTT